MSPMTIEWIGYIASFIVLVSLLMGSIKKLRWINLLGSFVFGMYGVLIGSWPVMAMNTGIVLINVYYLFKMYTSSDYFSILPIEEHTSYLDYFLQFHKENIETYIPEGTAKVRDADLQFLILRDTTPAGLFACKIINPTTLEILLDYVTPAYQDFKMGTYLFEKENHHFLDQGFKKFITYTDNDVHRRYLLKMGFAQESQQGKTVFVKLIESSS